MKFIFVFLFFSSNSFAISSEFTNVHSCAPESPASYIVQVSDPHNLSFVDGAHLAKKLSESTTNKIVSIRNVLLTYFVIQTSDLETLKTIYHPYLSKSRISIECNSPGDFE
ncbi:MAG: hypothetical protein HOO06_09875 [Bdellovibrionaceae bacterium]|jgi:hypothetical protein|nr:hypothetical protein [Pseudobdellovibrionaceae bacterium]